MEFEYQIMKVLNAADVFSAYEDTYGRYINSDFFCEYEMPYVRLYRPSLDELDDAYDTEWYDYYQVIENIFKMLEAAGVKDDTVLLEMC